jgi:hypothetical protein
MPAEPLRPGHIKGPVKTGSEAEGKYGGNLLSFGFFIIPHPVILHAELHTYLTQGEN